MVKWIKRKFGEYILNHLGEWIDEIILAEESAKLKQLDDNVADALISYNEYNEKKDTEEVEIEKLKEEMKELRKEIEELSEFKKDVSENMITPDQVLNEWFNGKEQGNG